MSTNQDVIAPDLDRTDELPRLDVEAYEASLANVEKGLARTDAWSVSALHDMQTLATTNAAHDTASSAAPTDSETGALTLNVDAILKRISDLESALLAAHEVSEAVRKQREAIEAERDGLVATVQALECENARQREHRELAQAIAERVERKQREDLEQAHARIEELQAILAAEREQTHAEREALRSQLTGLTDEHARLAHAHRSLQSELEDTRSVVRTKEEAIAQLETALQAEKTLAAQVTRQLAAKLTDYDKLRSMLEARTRVTNELVAARDELEQRLEAELDRGSELTRKVSEMEQRSEAQQMLLEEREAAIVEKDEVIAALRDEMATSKRKIEHIEQELSEVSAARRNAEDRTTELSAALDETHQTITSLRTALEEERARSDALASERDGLLPLASRIAALNDELARKDEELVRARELAAADLQTAQAQVLALAQERDSLRHLEAEVEGMRSRLREQTQSLRGLEHALATRDEIAAQLSSQLQVARDESAVLSSQLEKARRRVNALTQEVFRRDHRIAELRTELTVHTEALAAIRRNVNRIGAEESVEEEGCERVLEPVDHDASAIVLSGKILTVGRTAESDICIASKLVSRHHALLLVGPTGVIIEDAGSTNGCYVNGKQVRKHLMHEGDVLEIGDRRYRLQTRTAHDTKPRANVIPMFESRPQ